MAQVKVLARDWGVEVETAVADTFVEVGGVETLGFDMEKVNADSGDFQSGGWSEHIVAERGWSVAIEGHYKVDVTAGAGLGDRDAGFERLQVLQLLVGPAAEAKIRLTDPAGNEYEGSATFNARPTMGAKNDVSGISVDADGTGPLGYTPVA